MYYYQFYFYNFRRSFYRWRRLRSQWLYASLCSFTNYFNSRRGHPSWLSIFLF